MLPKITHKLLNKLTIPLFLWLCLVALPLTASAAKVAPPSGSSAPTTTTTTTTPTPAATNLGDPIGAYSCGGPGQSIDTAIDIGCRHAGNPILDSTFAIIRILSIGVGLVIVAGLIIAGLQLTASKGDPQLRAKAISRISNVVIALFVYIFAYAILNYVIPAGFFK